MLKRIMTCFCLTALMVTVASADSATDEFSRAGKWEVHGFGQYIRVADILGTDGDVFGGGLGVGYNVAEHFTINGDLSINSFEGETDTLFGPSKDYSTTVYMGTISLDYNILKTRLTPLVTAGAGIAYSSEESKTILNPSLGVGLRWDVNDFIFVKATVQALIWDLTEEVDRAMAAAFTLGVGLKF